MTEPKYPSWTRAERARQKRLERQREAELLQRVNERLAAHNIDWKQLMRLVASGEVEIVIREKGEGRMNDEVKQIIEWIREDIEFYDQLDGKPIDFSRGMDSL